MGKVSAGYIPTASFTASEDTAIYAVHRPLTTNDVDVSVGLELLASLEEFDSALSEGAGSIANLVDIGNRALTVIRDGESTLASYKNIMNDAYLEICTMEYTNKEDLFAQMDALIHRISERLEIPEVDRFKVVQCIVGITSCLVTGGGMIAAVTPFMGFYSQFFKSLMDRVYFVIMRNYIQTRVGERMMYAWGMSDGWN